MNSKLMKGILMMGAVIFAAIQTGDIVWPVTFITSACVGIGYFAKNLWFESASSDNVFDWRDVASALIISAVAAILGGMFVYRLWVDMQEARDIGAVGFFLLFTTIVIFDIWDAAIYVILAWNRGDATYVLPLTLLKPFIHSVEIIAYLILSLYFRKK